jgi:hypothetical protein
MSIHEEVSSRSRDIPTAADRDAAGAGTDADSVPGPEESP